MYFQIEIIRDENGEVTQRNIVAKSPQLMRIRNGKEIEVIESEDRNMELSKVSVDQDGKLFLEEDSVKIAAQTSEQRIALRIKRIEFGHRLVAIMSIRNDAKALNGAQIVQLVSDFADINRAWLNGSISTSRTLVASLTPDGTILTTADKTAILAEIDANLTALGY